jgi:hypothetical protein
MRGWPLVTFFDLGRHPRFRTFSDSLYAREAEWELGTLATDNIVRHSRTAESGEKRRRAVPVKVRPFCASKQQKNAHSH